MYNPNNDIVAGDDAGVMPQNVEQPLPQRGAESAELGRTVDPGADITECIKTFNDSW